ncbi:MAG: thioredoxin [Oscillospiraceae bacterium]|nr:thioredoxin [Oscillospiraceae bacterium]
MSNAISLKTADFADKVANNSGVVLVDFWASWCGPCMMLAPVIDELSADFAGRVDVYKVNVDEESELAAKFGIMSIPTIIIFKDGEVFDKKVGVLPKDSFAAALEDALK